ncbi:MAG: YciI family protein [Deltaproteobacteria bacterium]|nr:YciI family protein [Deltaproteobacteria bacterium]
MLYMILGTDTPGALPRRLEARPAHVARLKELEAAGRLVLAGPHPAVDSAAPGEAGFLGSLIVAEFPSLEEARAWAAADPYVGAGVYGEVVVRPFVRVLPGG